MQNDILFSIFMAQLEETSNLKEEAGDFVKKVSGLYSLHLFKSGSIPLHFVEDVVHDIQAEVIEMYRKKTYGFLTLEEFRKHYFCNTL